MRALRHFASRFPSSLPLRTRAMSSRPPLTLGIRAENKIRWERRVPLVPETVQKLIANDGVKVLCEPSTRRAFTDEEYKKVSFCATFFLLALRPEQSGVSLGGRHPHQ